MSNAIKEILGYGHQHNPLIRDNFAGMTNAELTAIHPQSQRGRLLIKSYQMMMAPEHERLVRIAHGRDPWFDGELGPATDQLFNPDEVERCGCADYQALDLEATGTGSWRPGCVAEHPEIHAVHYHIDDARAPSQVRQWWGQITDWVTGAFAEVGIWLQRTVERARAHIHVSWEVLRGSVIGLAQLPSLQAAQACSRGFFCKLDPGFLPSAIQVAKLWAHELWHNLRSGHISGDPVMGPTLSSAVWNRSFVGTPLGQRAKLWFGGQPVGPRPDPDPDPNPDPDPDADSLATLRADFESFRGMMLLKNLKQDLRIHHLDGLGA